MEPWLIWIMAGFILMTAELLLPGAITVFVGVAALITGLGIKFGYLDSMTSVLMTFFGSTIVLLIFLRSLFLKFFEGDSRVHDTNEEGDAIGSIVIVVEDIFPFKEGRVSFRGSSWQARSEVELLKGSEAIIVRLDGNILIVSSL